jgi:hypothetical protein
VALEGNLQDMPLEDLFQIFRSWPRSGVLLVDGSTEHGVIYVSHGDITDALIVKRVNRQIVATHEEAVIQLLQWDEATFTFRHDPSIEHRPTRIFNNNEWLILEGLRRRENPVRTSAHQTITLDTHLQLATPPHQADNNILLGIDQWRILSQISTAHNVREICNRTSIDAEKVLRLVVELVAIGLLEITIQHEQAHTPLKSQTPTNFHIAQKPAANGETASPIGAANFVRTPSKGLMDAIKRRIRGL